MQGTALVVECIGAANASGSTSIAPDVAKDLLCINVVRLGYNNNNFN
jgi:hypothetical protein